MKPEKEEGKGCRELSGTVPYAQPFHKSPSFLNPVSFIPQPGKPSNYKITFKRRTVQSIFLFLYFIFPLFGLFYFDTNSGNFVLLGKTIGLNNSVLFLIGSIILLLGVITMAITTGRSFCGWVCPQNFLSEMVNRVINTLALKADGRKKLVPYTIITLATFIISLSVAINFMFYFGKPADVYHSLISGELNGNVLIFAILFGFIVFAGIGIYRHDFCKYACPYGIMQASVADKTTMRVRFARERSSDCIDCNACTDICYVDIEPRKLVQADPGCMNCGLCVEACHQVLEPLGVKSMLDFTIEKDKTKKNLNNQAVAIMGSALLMFIIMFFFMFFNLAQVDLTVTRDDSFVSVIKDDGYLASKYFVQVMNQTAAPRNVGLTIEGFPAGNFLFEKDFLLLESGIKQKIQFAINVKKSELKPGIKMFNVIVFDKADNKVLNKIRSSLFVPQ